MKFSAESPDGLVGGVQKKALVALYLDGTMLPPPEKRNRPKIAFGSAPCSFMPDHAASFLALRLISRSS